MTTITIVTSPVPDDAVQAVLAARGRTAAAFHRSVMWQLTQAGYRATREHPTPYQAPDGTTRNGRIDVVARKGSTAVAIELDRLRPREKSTEKILASGLPGFVACRSA